MYLRLRQVALVAGKLEPVLVQLRRVLGLEVCFRDPGIARHGLENALLPIGPVFIEVVAPVQPNTTAERYLERRKGDGGYMFIVDCDNVGRRREHVKAMGSASSPRTGRRAQLQSSRFSCTRRTPAARSCRSARMARART